MPDFADVEWEGYGLKLRASDDIRRIIAGFDLGDQLMYFLSTDIYLDVRVSLDHKEKNIASMKDMITYDWFLCYEDGRPVKIEPTRILQLFHAEGNGKIEFAKANKFKKFDILKTGELFWSSRRNGNTFFRQNRAIHIGHISEGKYTIGLQFRNAQGTPSEHIYMGHFTIFDKDKTRDAIIVTIIGVVGTAVAAFTLFLFGIRP